MREVFGYDQIINMSRLGVMRIASQKYEPHKLHFIIALLDLCCIILILSTALLGNNTMKYKK